MINENTKKDRAFGQAAEMRGKGRRFFLLGGICPGSVMGQRL
jgi:hypothetical protein